MEDGSTSSHYSSLASKTSEYSEEAHPLVVSILHHLLRLEPSCRLVDFGAGACKLASQLYRAGGLRKPVLCVEPSPEMLELGSSLAGVHGICLGGLEWSQALREDSIDAILIRQAVHHIPKDQHLNLFGNLFKGLAKGGRLCLTKRGDLEDLFPWPAGFYESVTKKSEHTVSEFRALLKAVGFEGIVVEKRETEKMENKTKVFERFRTRFLSWFHQLTDEDIEEGIARLETEHSGSEIPVVSSEIFIFAEKR